MKHLLPVFEKTFHAAAEVLASAPGRLEILGNHTDYNEGIVLSCAVDQRTGVAMRKTDSKRAVIYDARAKSRAEIDLDKLVLPITPKWAGYPAGVLYFMI